MVIKRDQKLKFKQRNFKTLRSAKAQNYLIKYKS